MNSTRLLRGLAVLFLGLSQAKSQTLRPPQGTPAPASRYLDPSQGKNIFVFTLHVYKF